MRSRTVRPYVLLPELPYHTPTHYCHPCWVDPLGTCLFTSWTSELQDGSGCLTNRVGFRMVSGCKRSCERKSPSPACLTLLVGGPQTQFQRVACVKSLQSCPTLCDPMDCSPPGSSVHGILQARTLEWAALPSSRACWPSSPPSPTLEVGSLPLAPPGKLNRQKVVCCPLHLSFMIKVYNLLTTNEIFKKLLFKKIISFYFWLLLSVLHLAGFLCLQQAGATFLLRPVGFSFQWLLSWRSLWSMGSRARRLSGCGPQA